MDKNILSAFIADDETVPFTEVEPFDSAGFALMSGIGIWGGHFLALDQFLESGGPLLAPINKKTPASYRGSDTILLPGLPIGPVVLVKKSVGGATGFFVMGGLYHAAGKFGYLLAPLFVHFFNFCRLLNTQFPQATSIHAMQSQLAQ